MRAASSIRARSGNAARRSTGGIHHTGWLARAGLRGEVASILLPKPIRVARVLLHPSRYVSPKIRGARCDVNVVGQIAGAAVEDTDHVVLNVPGEVAQQVGAVVLVAASLDPGFILRRGVEKSLPVHSRFERTRRAGDMRQGQKRTVGLTPTGAGGGDESDRDDAQRSMPSPAGATAARGAAHGAVLRINIIECPRAAKSSNCARVSWGNGPWQRAS